MFAEGMFDDVDVFDPEECILGVAVNAEDEVLGAPLLLAAETGNMEDLKKLLQAGAKVNFLNASGISSLHIAAEKGHSEIVKALLEAGAEVDNRERHSHYILSSPLHMAARSNNVEMAKSLMKAGGDVNRRDIHGSTPVHMAALTDSVEVMKELIKAGANVDVKDAFSTCTPLNTCSFKHKAKIPVDATFSKFPVNDLSCAQVIIKYSLLYSSLSDKYWQSVSGLPEFFHACSKEVAAMKKDLITDEASLYGYLKKANVNPEIQCNTARSNRISDAIFQRAVVMKYPVYSDVLCENLGRCYFEAKFVKCILYAELKSLDTYQKEITLEADSMLAIAKYLSLYDLAKFVLALNNPNLQ